MIFMKYLEPVRPKLVSKLKMVMNYWNLAHLIFQICRSRFWCQKWFLLNIYHLLQIFPKIKSARNLLKYVTFDISITVIYWFIYGKEYWLSKKSNVSFCRWFELYWLFSPIFLLEPLIKMRGSNYYPLSESSFATKTTITLFYQDSALKVAYAIMKVSCLIKMFLLVFIMKRFVK